MSPNEFDRRLMEDLSQLPPEPGEVQSYTPWRAAMEKILWGMGLTTFQFDFFCLQYILPLLGAALLYLGYRSLRKENRWFGLCWVLSGVLLVIHMAIDILTATPVMNWIAETPAVNWGLTWPVRGMNLLLLFALWRGTRAAFVSVGEARPKDWLAQGFVCYLLAMAVALWAELVPATEPGIIGFSITNEWLYYGRPILFIALEIRLLWCIAHQSKALAGRGYEVVPTPVRLSSRTVLLGVFGAVLLAIPAALWIGGHIPTGPAEPVSLLTGEQEAIREHLVSLGLPEDLAAALDGAELERCAQAEFVEPGRTYDTNLTDDEVPRTDGPAVLDDLGGGEAELSSWLVFLPEGQVRQIHWFRYRELPSLHLQEQFSVDPSGNHQTGDYAGRLLWERDGQTLAVSPKVRLAGGQTAEELDEITAWIRQTELERFGYYHYSPWFDFSIPKGAENLRGWLAYTADTGYDNPHSEGYGDFVYVFLRHQTQWLHYPFVSVAQLGGLRSAPSSGPIQTIFAPFDYYT